MITALPYSGTNRPDLRRDCDDDPAEAAIFPVCLDEPTDLIYEGIATDKA